MAGKKLTVEQALANLQTFVDLPPSWAAAVTAEDDGLRENIRTLIQAFSKLQPQLRAAPRPQTGTLHHLVPICMYCKKVRDKAGDWDESEKVISTCGIRFSHSICPGCMAVYHPESSPKN